MAGNCNCNCHKNKAEEERIIQANKDARCPKCNGLGWFYGVFTDSKCMFCRGTGFIK